MTEQLPLFPLGTVLFPGAVLPLHVFEARYRDLVRHLLAIPDPALRVFGVVAIREGYEVGDHAAQSLHTIGCVAQVTEVEAHDDGTYDLEVVGRQRMGLRGVDTSGAFLVGDVELILDPTDLSPEGVDEAERTVETFETYRDRLADLRGADVLEVDLPHDPEFLSYTLAATCMLTLRERQELLEAETASERLVQLRTSMREEMRAMRAIPSLPATEVARMAWSPN